jgi:hypothetical protein
MTAASPTAMSSFRPRYRAVERQERAHEREWRSQSEPAQNERFIVMNGASPGCRIARQTTRRNRARTPRWLLLLERTTGEIGRSKIKEMTSPEYLIEISAIAVVAN